jgi:hypothetical protein
MVSNKSLNNQYFTLTKGFPSFIFDLSMAQSETRQAKEGEDILGGSDHVRFSG